MNCHWVVRGHMGSRRHPVGASVSVVASSHGSIFPRRDVGTSIDFDGAESVGKLQLLPCDAAVSPTKAAEELSQFTRFGLLSIDTDTSQDELAKELSGLVKLGLLPTDTRSSDEEIELELGFRFYVDGGPRLPWRLLIRCFWWALFIVPFCFVAFQLVTVLTRLPASRRPARHSP